MIRRTKSKRQLKAEANFKAAVTEFILGLGARPGSFYDYEMDTPADLLYLSVHENWLATRFDNVALGRSFSESFGRSCNPYSGKWNFHYSDTHAVEVVLSDLGYWFDQLMNWESTS